MSEASRTVGFRLEPTYKKRLDEEARRLGVAPGTLARRLVVEALDDRDRGILRLAIDRLEAALESLQGEVAAGRQDLQTVKTNLRNATLRLLTLSDPLSARDANEWVDKRLKE